MRRSTSRVLTQRVADVLGALDIEDGFVRLPVRLDRKLYIAVDEALRSLGGRWDRQRRGHVFDADPSTSIEAMVLAGSFVDLDDLYQFFETPLAIAQRVVSAARIPARPGAVVLEPSAGRGAMLRAMPRSVSVVAVEVDQRHFRALSDELASMGDGRWSINMGDFLHIPPLPRFDCIAMNPPFEGGRDVAHVAHAVNFLAPGGCIAAVMAAGVDYRMDDATRSFRDAFTSAGGKFDPLPHNCFRDSGTSVRTVLATWECPC